MGFYMCPLDPKVKNIFIGSEAGLLKKRIPISIRAKLNYPKSPRIQNKDWQNKGKPDFKLRGNTISFDRNNEVNENIINTSLYHLIPIFKDNNLRFDVFGKINRPEIRITLSIKESLTKGCKHAHENYIGRLVYAISHSDNRIDLEWIGSRKLGNGGKMLIALYNIAKDLKIKNIFFYPDNRAAKQFYYRMDFGSNDYEVDHRIAIDWKVDVK